MLQQRDSHIMWISSKMSFGCFFFLFFLFYSFWGPALEGHPRQFWRIFPRPPRCLSSPADGGDWQGSDAIKMNAVEGFGPHVPQAIIALKLTAINWFVFFPILSL